MELFRLLRSEVQPTMCFVLYTGTSRPIARKEWTKDAPDLCVKQLSEREKAVAAHFSKPQVQHIGSTSGCGCDFPHALLQNGEWPWFDFGQVDDEQAARDRYNRQALVDLLRQTGEASVELYGVWDGNTTRPVLVAEEIRLDEILSPAFRFKEQGFYTVSLEPANRQ